MHLPPLTERGFLEPISTLFIVWKMGDSPSGDIIVLKVGTSSLVDTKTRKVQVSSIARVAETAAALVSRGFRPIVVSSGAVGLGCSRLGLRERPTHIAGKQAAAAVGQGKLMSLYDDIFSVLGHVVAQVLLTYDNFGDRMQHSNARCAFLELLNLGVIPIVNENDTVAVQELRVGDNDTLSALVAGMVGAKWLLLLTDVEALYDADPRTTPDAHIIRTVQARDIYGLRRQMQAGCPRLIPGAPIADSLGNVEQRPLPGSPKKIGNAATAGSCEAAPGGTFGPSSPVGGAGSAFGTGGMSTKLKAAQLATAAGTAVVVMDTSMIHLVSDALIQNEKDGREGFSSRALGTTFLPVPDPVPVLGRKRWVLSIPPSGTILVDAGAVRAIEAHKSLFPAGIKGVEGVWDAQDAVALVCADTGKEVARALCNYNSSDVAKLKGLQSAERSETLGYEGAEAVADRGNIVIL